MEPPDREWDNIPDDQVIRLTKGDIDAIMSSMLHVQLIGIYASGLIRALKEKNEDRYEELWDKLKHEVLTSRDFMSTTLRDIAHRNSDRDDA